MVVCCWAGDIEEGERFIRPLKEFGSPVLDVCVPKPFLTHQAMFDPSFPPGRWYYFKSCDVAELNDEIIDITVGALVADLIAADGLPDLADGRRREPGRATTRPRSAAARPASPTTSAPARRPVRDSRRNASGYADFWSALQPWHEGVYVNFLGDEGAERIRQAYGSQKYDQLQALKRKYDPDNFFRINQNIPPN